MAGDREREQLRAELARARAELDELAYLASHDLKGPLRGIASLSQWIEDDLGDRLGERGREHLRLLRGRVDRLEALLDGVVQLARAGAAAEAPQAVDLGELVREVTARLRPPPAASVAPAPDLPRLVTERAALARVLTHLIENALRHAGRPDVRIEVRARRRGALWEIAVRDDGAGIAPAFHERIWRPFQTLRPRDRVEGAGVGLAVVRKIVERRGGAARVDSREGEGATFSFTWPGG
ncbi:MAG TPA: ATP-binding protein [Kofleriaceae bacterium]|nr:ATP-binding protein [Kofleriaceae bacterium]